MNDTEHFGKSTVSKPWCDTVDGDLRSKKAKKNLGLDQKFQKFTVLQQVPDGEWDGEVLGRHAACLPMQHVWVRPEHLFHIEFPEQEFTV